MCGQNVKRTIEELKKGTYDALFKRIYVDEAMLAYQRKRYIESLHSYMDLFGNDDIEIYSAPGRSEVGGNHTDHQYGQVLATSINLDAIGIVSGTTDNYIRLKSEGYDRIEIDLNKLDIAREEEGTTAALIKGVAAKLKEDGYQTGGFKAFVTSDVLSGAGMSSSAAFEVLLCNIFSGIYNDGKLDSIYIAQVGQYAENVFFGKPCGLMDQMASSVGGMIYIDFNNPLIPTVKRINTDFEKYEHSLCIVDTKGSHADLTDEYAAIPKEMKAVAGYFGKDVLRRVEKKMFYENLPKLRDLYGDRAVLRSIHFFEENDRVLNQVKALENSDFEAFKALVRESGNSSFMYLQNAYTSKDIQHQNVAIGLAVSNTILKNKGVCRVHGGGFAGTIQAFVPNDMVNAYRDAIEDVFGKKTCHILKVRNDGGIKVL